jgi:hypothetical protein
LAPLFIRQTQKGRRKTVPEVAHRLTHTVMTRLEDQVVAGFKFLSSLTALHPLSRLELITASRSCL